MVITILFILFFCVIIHSIIHSIIGLIKKEYKKIWILSILQAENYTVGDKQFRTLKGKDSVILNIYWLVASIISLIILLLLYFL